MITKDFLENPINQFIDVADLRNFFRKSLILDSILICSEPKFLFSLIGAFTEDGERKEAQKQFLAKTIIYWP